MDELYIKNKDLIKEKDWKKIIGEIKKSTKEIKNKKTIKENLKKELKNSIKKRIPQKKFGILFSGGIDSTLIAYLLKKELKKDFICYSVGLKDSIDLKWSKKVSKNLNLNLKYQVFDLNEIEKIIKKTTKILGEPSVIKVGVGAVVLAASELAKKDNVQFLFSGLGSEEIFAGYERHKVEDINKECWRGLKLMWERDLVRDFKISKKLKINLLTPFLDKDLIKVAMQIPSEFKLNQEYKKVILREAAQELGIPKEFAWRKKKAAQYGSGFDKSILKIAKKKGFRYKKDYLGSLL